MYIDGGLYDRLMYIDVFLGSHDKDFATKGTKLHEGKNQSCCGRYMAEKAIRSLAAPTHMGSFDSAARLDSGLLRSG